MHTSDLLRRARNLLPLVGLGTQLIVSSPTRAASFSYANGDLLACFRSEGGAADLVARLGSVSDFEGLEVGSTRVMTNVLSGQLSAAFPSLGGVSWSVIGVMRGNTNLPRYALHTLWVTSPNLDEATPGPVWVRQGPFTQGPVGSQIDAIGAGAATYASQQPAGSINSAAGLVIPSNDPNAYSALITSAGNLAGTFQGSIEAITTVDHGIGSRLSRSILYQLAPGTGATLNAPGRAMGYFDFASDGTLTFVAGPLPARILGIEVLGNQVRVRVASLPAYAYRLRVSDADGLGKPVSRWEATGTTVIGDGSTLVLQAPMTSAAGFYAVETAP